jgi:ammonia channel protein AmtB
MIPLPLSIGLVNSVLDLCKTRNHPLGKSGAVIISSRWNKKYNFGILGIYNSIFVSYNIIIYINMPLAAPGVFILWLGWFGFNPGSDSANRRPA